MLIRQVREAVRSLVRSPGYTATAVLSVGGGIGLACSVYAVVAAIFFAEPPYQDPKRLVEFWQTSGPASSQPQDYLQPVRMEAWVASQQEFRTLAQVAATGLGPSLILRRTDGPVKVSVAPVLGDWFGTLRVEAHRGRVLTPDDLRPGAAPSAVVSDAFWQRHLSGGDLGTIVLSGTPYSVVGVMPEQFSASETVWIPIETLPPGSEPVAYAGVGRLRDGSHPEDAAAEVERLAGLQVQADSGRYGGLGATVRPLGDLGRSGNKPQLWALAGVSLAVLLVALNNLTVLTLVRTQSRATVLAVRASLGANRWELGRGLATEGALIGLSGAIFGLILSYWAKDAAVGLLGVEIAPHIGAGVILLALGLGSLVTVLVGFEPMRRVGSLDLQHLLQRRSGGANTTPGERRTRRTLIAAQVAVCLVLLTVATVLGGAYRSYGNLDVGFDAGRVIEAHPDWDIVGMDADQQWVTAHTLVERLASLPQVDHATSWQMIAEDYPPRPEYDPVTDNPGVVLSRFDHLARYYEVGAHFFQTLGIELVQGRSFTADDGRGGPPVAVITENGARAFWPDSSPIGRQLKLGQAGAWMTIVGVVADMQQLDAIGRTVAIRDRSPVFLFLPAGQFEGPPVGWRSFDCCAGVRVGVRSNGSSGAAERATRELLAREAPDLPVISTGSLYESQMQGFLGREVAATASMLGGGATLAMFLAIVGIVGVVSESVSRRTREIGVRVALGARPSQVFGALAKDGVWTVLLGLGIGLASLLLLREWLTTLVFSPFVLQLAPGILSPQILGAVIGLLVGVTMVAVYGTARRALRVDPVEALRAD